MNDEMKSEIDRSQKAIVNCNDACWPATKALTVYTVLRCSGAPMSAQQIHAYLDAINELVSTEYIAVGIEFLRTKGWIDGDATIRLTTPTDARGIHTLAIRCAADSDLAIAGGAR
jgi:hypothetical protein